MRLMSFILRHLQWVVGIAVYHMPNRTLLIRWQVLEQLSGWILCRQEAAGVCVLCHWLCHMHQQWLLFNVP